MLKNKILVLALAAAVIFMLGCQPEKPKVMELTVLNYLDLTAPSAKNWDKLVAGFEAANPGIKLKVENYYDEAYHQKLKALAAANNLPDVMYLWPGGRSSEVTGSGLIADLTTLLAPIKDNFAPAALAPQGDGKIFELPFAVTATHVLFVNTKVLKDLGAEMPKTMDELKALVAKAKKAKIETVIMPNKDAWVMQSCLFSAVVGRVGGMDWLKKAIAGQAAFTDAEFVDSLKAIQDMYASEVLPPTSIALGYGDGPALFAQGKGIFMIDGDWRTQALIDVMSNEEQANIELAVLPDLAGQKGESGSTSMVPSTGFGMKAGLDKVKADAAWKMISYFCGAEGAKFRLENEGMPPAYKLDVTGIDLKPLAKKRIAFYPQHPGTYVLDDKISGEPINILNNGLQELALKKITPADLAKKFDDAFKALKK